MWDDLLQPGRLALVSAPQRLLTGFLQELTHHAVHRWPGDVLWCDGGHTFNPAEFGELNLVRGLAADDGAPRVLVKRCMTPFQWDSTLSSHLPERLMQGPASLVVVNPFDALWTHEEIQDWEQEDYTRFSLAHLAKVAAERQVPIVLGVDMERWWRTHPVLAKATADAVPDQWSVGAPDGRWRAVRDRDRLVLDPYLRRSVTLLDYVEGGAPLLLPEPSRRRRRRKAAKADPLPTARRTRILHRSLPEA